LNDSLPVPGPKSDTEAPDTTEGTPEPESEKQE
jgi:hypothetical protein